MRTMARFGLVMMIVLTATAVWAGEKVSIEDDCDSTDAAWNSVGGCTLEDGNVTLAEFNLLLSSPLSLATVGHPAWRMDPTYLKTEPEETVHVTNNGGRNHTFTEVAHYGGGVVPGLNIGLTKAPECTSAHVLLPGDSENVTALSVGIHEFQCCIHPWMRALIKVLDQEE